MKKIIHSLLLTQKDNALRGSWNGLKMVVQSLISLRLDTTQLITEVFMLREISRRVRPFSTYLRNRSSLLRWLSPHLLAARCMKRVWDSDWSHRSILSWPPSSCRKEGSQNQCGNITLTSYQSHTPISLSSSQLKRRSGWKEAPSLIKLRRRSLISSPTMTSSVRKFQNTHSFLWESIQKFAWWCLVVFLVSKLKELKQTALLHMQTCLTTKDHARLPGTTPTTAEALLLRPKMTSKEVSRYTIVMERSAIVVSSWTTALSTWTMMPTKCPLRSTTMKMISLSRSSRKWSRTRLSSRSLEWSTTSMKRWCKSSSPGSDSFNTMKTSCSFTNTRQPLSKQHRGTAEETIQSPTMKTPARVSRPRTYHHFLFAMKRKFFRPSQRSAESKWTTTPHPTMKIWRSWRKEQTWPSTSATVFFSALGRRKFYLPSCSTLRRFCLFSTWTSRQLARQWRRSGNWMNAMITWQIQSTT